MRDLCEQIIICNITFWVQQKTKTRQIEINLVMNKVIGIILN